MKRLSDAEFEIMQLAWEQTPPISARMLSDQLEQKDWKLNTILTMLSRLVDKGILRSEKQGPKSRVYFPIVTKEDYLEFETKQFMQQYHGGSVHSLVAALSGGSLTDCQRRELERLIDSGQPRSPE
ncbi:BlaI/MecI/CopY family transcriptional regulator [Christensenellaceae bacterium OttesenSCG-928-K19]|nr:BlaI/MecI/CopY family transcriptional regulator [Christensenellaceae bacterium OttesenSCG-928-K19]